MRWLCALVLTLTLTLFPAVPARAQEEPDLEFFYPVVTRRPVIERELELRAQYEKSRDGRQVDTAAAVEWPVLPRWQIELEFPVVVNDPQDGPAAAGFGDIAIENKVLLWKSVQQRLLVAGGVELTLPSGSRCRDLGGELALEPFLAAAIALGPFDLLGSVAYEWNLTPGVQGPREQEFTGNLALAYILSRWFTPFLELNTVTQTVGAPEEPDEPSVPHRVQAYLTPGFNVRPLPGMTFRAGVQLPVTPAREFDYVVHAGLVWEF
jgi:hypothetical protein